MNAHQKQHLREKMAAELVAERDTIRARFSSMSEDLRREIFVRLAQFVTQVGTTLVNQADGELTPSVETVFAMMLLFHTVGLPIPAWAAAAVAKVPERPETQQ